MLRQSTFFLSVNVNHGNVPGQLIGVNVKQAAGWVISAPTPFSPAVDAVVDTAFLRWWRVPARVGAPEPGQGLGVRFGRQSR